MRIFHESACRAVPEAAARSRSESSRVASRVDQAPARVIGGTQLRCSCDEFWHFAGVFYFGIFAFDTPSFRYTEHWRTWETGCAFFMHCIPILAPHGWLGWEAWRFTLSPFMIPSSPHPDIYVVIQRIPLIDILTSTSFPPRCQCEAV